MRDLVHTLVPWAFVAALVAAWPTLPNGIPGKKDRLEHAPRPIIEAQLDEVYEERLDEPRRPLVLLVGDSRLNHGLRGLEDLTVKDRCVALEISPCPLVRRILVPAARMSDFAPHVAGIVKLKPRALLIQADLALNRPDPTDREVINPDRMRTLPRPGVERTDADLANLKYRWGRTSYDPEERDLAVLRRIHDGVVDRKHALHLFTLPRSPTVRAVQPVGYADAFRADLRRISKDNKLRVHHLGDEVAWTDEDFFDFVHMNAQGTDKLLGTGIVDWALRLGAK